MDEEDVIGDEFDRALLSTAMSISQSAEAFRRRNEARDVASRRRP
ncbi:hypothetical protein [Microbacterium testaceum]|nr:hypothetical protein [Microbacterium testaceum]